ncbi:MAG: flagellar hook-basal body complex protein [Planctomycetes bacterium]|nr:flagellar hook-basal body complex protein [Planctomycetota bacterium]
MGLTSAMYTGLSGLNVNQARIETIGNNLANANTTAYKGSRTLFETQFSQIMSMGNGPNDTSGGTNPTQVGLGAVVGATQRSFTPGSIEMTGITSDMAIDGTGLFILRSGANQRAYTRDGSFSISPDNHLVTTGGDFVQGFGVDENFTIIPGVLRDLEISLGTLSIASATDTVSFDGDLSADGTLATQSSANTSQALVNGGGGAAGTSTLLTDLRSGSAPGSTLFAAGDTLTVSGVTKGDRTLPSQSFVVGGTGTTLGDLASWLEGVLGIQTGTGLPGTPGVVVENGTLVIRGNAGEENNIVIDSDAFGSDGPTAPLPLQFTQTASANGSGTFTSFTAYDSLGTPVIVSLSFALESTPDTGPVWRYYAECDDATGSSRVLGTGTVSFDTQGNFLSTSGEQLTIDRSQTGAGSPLMFTLDFSGIHGLSTQVSQIVMAEQDGFPPGTLANWGVGADGTISGVFTNGTSRTLGQVALAVFPNPQGLVSGSDNKFYMGPNAGTLTVTAPDQFGAGQVLGGALEQANVDLSREFIGLITSSAGYQASSRVISVSSDLLNQLLLIVR